MAAPMENSLSPGRLNGPDRNTFTAHRQQGVKHSLHWPMLQADVPTPHSRQHLRMMYLQRRWQELKERERKAQQHNAQLLQQFDKAQDKLREMLARNAAMKTVRMEYERYLQESAPHWQYQTNENPAQRKWMEEYLTSHLKSLQEEQMRRLSLDQISFLQGSEPQNITAFQNNNQDPSLHRHPHTHPQSDGCPTNMPPQPHSSSHLEPPAVLPSLHQLHLLSSTLPHQHLWPGQDPSGQPLSWSTGATGFPYASEALWTQLRSDKPPQERAAEAAGSRAAREMSNGSRGTHYSQELDMNPVRLSSGRAESSESGSQVSGDETKRKKKRERARQTSSHRGSCSPEDLSSSQTSSAIVIPGVSAGRRSESDTSSKTSSTGKGQRSKRTSGALIAASPQTRNERAKGERNERKKPKEETPSAGDESGSPTDKDTESQCPVDQSDGEEESDKIQNGDAVKEKQEREESSVGEGSEEEEDEEELQNDLIDERSRREGGSSGKESDEEGEEDMNHLRENSGFGEEEEGKMVRRVDVRGDDEDETGGEEESGDDEDNEKINQGSASSQDEGEVDGDEDNIGEDEESEEEEKEDKTERKRDKISEDEESNEEEARHRETEVVEEEDESGEEDGEDEEEGGGDEAREEEDDSDDSIISPQEKRLRKIHIIPEEAEDDEGGDEDEETSGSKSGSSGRDEFSDDDIEDLLAPQEQKVSHPNPTFRDKDLEDKDKVKASCDYVELFKAEDSSTKTNPQTDSDEFDHFYD